MFIVYALLSFLFWGIADLFYKKGNNLEGNSNHIKTGIIVGIVMGIHATIYLIINHVEISIVDMVKYLPVSAFYISSMVIGYKGLKYIELSIIKDIKAEIIDKYMSVNWEMGKVSADILKIIDKHISRKE